MMNSQYYYTNYNQQSNGFVGQYVNSFEEVERAQVSMSGIPTMFVGDGLFWIKKFVNGQPYISTYKFEAINNVGEPVIENKQADLSLVLAGLEKTLNNLNDRLLKLEGGKE